jgi:hypothetical protein
MNKTIKIHNIIDIIENLKSMEHSKCNKFFFNENVYLSVSYDFSKFEESKKIKV